jgi:hypothetical protein
MGRVKPNDPSAHWCWMWMPMGEVQSDGAPFRLAVAASNEDQLPEAFFDLGPVAFVEHTGRPAPAELHVDARTVTLEPGSEMAFHCPLPAIEGENTKVCIDFWDSGSNESRSLNCRISPGRR